MNNRKIQNPAFSEKFALSITAAQNKDLYFVEHAWEPSQGGEAVHLVLTGRELLDYIARNMPHKPVAPVTPVK